VSGPDLREPTFLARDGWKHADKWTREGRNFCVQVARHSTPEFNGDYTQVIGTEHHWCVYLFVYAGHPDFSRFNPGGDMWSQPSYECHSYVSLFKAHRDSKGEIASFQLGWDYAHDGDSQYAELATASAASSVFYDASRLFDEAKERADGVQP
jgi:hypothetical protein